MKNLQTMRAVGLMSGTSMDGIDAALIETNGDEITDFGGSVEIPYDDTFRNQLRGLMGRKAEDDAETLAVVMELTRLHGVAVNVLVAQSGLKPTDIGVVGFHGQTVFHDPAAGVTCQIGDGAELARMTGIKVVNNFRSADVAAGGEGAPLAPIYHVALSRPLERPPSFDCDMFRSSFHWQSQDLQIQGYSLRLHPPSGRKYVLATACP